MAGMNHGLPFVTAPSLWRCLLMWPCSNHRPNAFLEAMGCLLACAYAPGSPSGRWQCLLHGLYGVCAWWEGCAGHRGLALCTLFDHFMLKYLLLLPTRAMRAGPAFPACVAAAGPGQWLPFCSIPNNTTRGLFCSVCGCFHIIAITCKRGLQVAETLTGKAIYTFSSEACRGIYFVMPDACQEGGGGNRFESAATMARWPVLALCSVLNGLDLVPAL